MRCTGAQHGLIYGCACWVIIAALNELVACLPCNVGSAKWPISLTPGQVKDLDSFEIQQLARPFPEKPEQSASSSSETGWRAFLLSVGGPLACALQLGQADGLYILILQARRTRSAIDCSPTRPHANDSPSRR
jgi:hypothetical protein